MNCPVCNVKLKVLRTLQFQGKIYRTRICPKCRREFNSTEELDKNMLTEKKKK